MSKHLIPGSGTNYINGCYLPTAAQPGQVWFDTSTSTLKTYDGSMWIDIEVMQPTLSYDSEQAIDWAIDKMRCEEKISQLADKYPVVAQALGQLEVALKLCQNLETDGNTK